MAATSRNPPTLPPDVQLDVKLELADGTLLSLTRDQVLKSITVRDLTIDAELYTLIIPVTKYSAKPVKRFFSLFNQIEKRADLAQHGVTLNQLIDLLPIADFFAAETLMNNLIDYILATILANLNISEKVKKEIQSKYRKLSDILADAVHSRLAMKMSETSVKNVRAIIPRPEESTWGPAWELRNLIVTDYGQLVVNYRESNTKYEELYDETNGQRAEKFNQLIENLIEEDDIYKTKFELGGILGDKTSFFFQTYPHFGIKTISIENKYYGPGQSLGVDLPFLPDDSDLLLYGNRIVINTNDEELNLEQALSIYKAARADGQEFDELDRKIFMKQYAKDTQQWKYQIIELPSGKILFSDFISTIMDADQSGKYVVRMTSIVTSLATDSPISSVLELFEIDGRKRLFRVILDELVIEGDEMDPGGEITIDPIRRLLYIKIGNRVKVNYSISDVDLWVSLILVVNFEGKIIHRYFAGLYDIYFKVAGSKLITTEHYYRDQMAGEATVLEVDSFSFGGPIFLPGSEVAKYQEMAQLPSYEPFPNLPLNPEEYQYDPEFEKSLNGAGYSIYSKYRKPGYKGIWLRDPDNGFQPIARISDLPINIVSISQNQIKINPSPDGQYAVIDFGEPHKINIYKLTLYDKAEEKAILDILTPTEAQSEPECRKESDK